MPFVRCKFYTESGEPVGVGCRRKGTGCAFVHPGDPGWGNAPPPSFRAKDKSGDSASFRSWGAGNRRGSATSSAWDTGGNTSANAPDAGSGWGAESGRGTASGWDTVGEWSGGGGEWGAAWGAGGAATTPNASEVTRVNKTTSRRASAPMGERHQADSSAHGQSKGTKQGWGGATDKATGSGWGSASNDGWGAAKDADKGSGSGWGSAANDGWGGAKDANNNGGSGWGDSLNDTGSSRGDARDTDKSGKPGWGNSQNDAWGSGRGDAMDTDTSGGSGWGSSHNDTWGSGREDAKDTEKGGKSEWGSSQNNSGRGDVMDTDQGGGSGWGTSPNDAWGLGWGGNKNTTNSDSHAAPEPMMVDNPAPTGNEPEQSKGKGKLVPAPPRIRIPDNKKPKLTGTNNEALGTSKWGEPRSSNIVTSSTPATTSTPITAITPTDPTRLKRKRDAASGDEFDLFKDYVKAWERGVRARFLLSEAEAKRDRWFRTQKSACYARIGEAGRKRLDDQRTECDREVKSQWDKFSSAVTSLVQFHDTMSSNLDLGQRYKIGEEAEKFIVESKAFVDEVRTLLVEHVLKDKGDAQSRGIKETPPGANDTSIESLRKRLADLEERFDQAQAELTLRRQHDIHSDVDNLLAEKIVALRVARQREVDCIASQPRPEIVIPPSAVQSMEATAKQVNELDAKVPRTVEDIRVLLLRVDATTKRVSELEEELSMNKATYGKVQEMAAEKEKTERRIDERLNGLREQFKQLIAVAEQPAGPNAVIASSTVDNSQDKLMESFRPVFEASLGKFYEQEVQPTIESLQRIVIQASNRHQEEAMKVLWGKIQPAMNMVAGVSRWLDSQELALTAPVQEVDHMHVTSA